MTAMYGGDCTVDDLRMMKESRAHCAAAKEKEGKQNE